MSYWLFYVYPRLCWDQEGCFWLFFTTCRLNNTTQLPSLDSYCHPVPWTYYLHLISFGFVLGELALRHDCFQGQWHELITRAYRDELFFSILLRVRYCNVDFCKYLQFDDHVPLVTKQFDFTSHYGQANLCRVRQRRSFRSYSQRKYLHWCRIIDKSAGSWIDYKGWVAGLIEGHYHVSVPISPPRFYQALAKWFIEKEINYRVIEIGGLSEHRRKSGEQSRDVFGETEGCVEWHYSIGRPREKESDDHDKSNLGHLPRCLDGFQGSGGVCTPDLLRISCHVSHV